MLRIQITQLVRYMLWISDFLGHLHTFQRISWHSVGGAHTGQGLCTTVASFGPILLVVILQNNTRSFHNPVGAEWVRLFRTGLSAWMVALTLVIVYSSQPEMVVCRVSTFKRVFGLDCRPAAAVRVGLLGGQQRAVTLAPPSSSPLLLFFTCHQSSASPGPTLFCHLFLLIIPIKQGARI